jgi:hypothetical protein
MIIRKLYSPEDGEGGGDPPKKKEPPKGYKPTTKEQRRDWNDFLDYLQGQGVAGSKELDQPDKNIGKTHIEKYRKEHPETSVSEDIIPFVQYEQQAFRTGESFPGLSKEQLSVLRKQVNPDYLKRPTAEPGTPFNSVLSREYYPQFSKGEKSYGTDMEGYLKDFSTVEKSKPVDKKQEVVPEKQVEKNDPSKPVSDVHRKEELKARYKDNPYLSDQARYNWGSKLSNEFPLTGGKVKDAVQEAAKFNGVDSALLYSSAMEEGMSGSVDAKYSGDASEAYVDWATKNSDKAEEYPVDGFHNYGLDQFVGMAHGLEKKGYLPKGFSDKFTSFDAENEKGEKLKVPAFKKDSDALIAKSAMMRLAKDQLEEHTKEHGIKLTPKQKEFFLLANYNGGEGLMQSMIQSYKEKGYLKDDSFLDTKFKPASYAGVYHNVQARLQSAQQLKKEKYFD